MPLEPELRAMLTQTVDHAAYVGQDEYGKPVYGPTIQRPAHIARRERRITNAQGQERTLTTVVYMNGDFAMTLQDHLILPDGTAPQIQAIYSPVDPTQPGMVDHHEISL